MSTSAASQSATSMPKVLNAHPVDPAAGISTKEELRNHLIQAAAVEMQTIPMYLYAGYSIAGQGTSRWSPGMSAQRLIRSIVIEEMLHLCLVRNLLVAIGCGDQVKFYDVNFMPDYPEYMLHRHPALLLTLQRCTKDLVRNVFMAFERPDPALGESPAPEGQYQTIGQFYESVRKGVEKLNGDPNANLWGSNRPEMQYVSAYWNKDGGGSPMLIKDYATAETALKVIVEQGEGAKTGQHTVPIDPVNPKAGLDELPHHTKFQRIADGIEPIGPIWNVPDDPQFFMYEENETADALSKLFNAAYCYVLHLIDVLYETSGADVRPGSASERWKLERMFISAMQGVLANIAEIMVALPLGPDPFGGTEELQMAPTFQYVELPETGKRQHLIDLCDKAITHAPQLGGDNSVRWLLAKMPDV
ncbi:ferritin-like domain-containing protein [Actinomadura darangshiensis]|nr:ferritin-like protein [Actinomadura darangshiensis]